MNIYSFDKKIDNSLSQLFGVSMCFDYSEPDIVENNKTFIPWNKGKKGIYSDEHRKSISDRQKCQKYRLNKKHTNETKLKISESSLKRDHSYKNKKVCTPLGSFDSISSAARAHDRSCSWMTKKMKTNMKEFFIR
jgi:hypothetical protein